MKKSKLALATLFTAYALLAGSAYGAGAPAKIEQLSWMTGNWAGMIGPNQLEENWINTDGRSLMAAVRISNATSTGTFEMITIEEVDGSLVLHIQQWDPGFSPRTAGAQEMILEEITGNSVKFRAVSEGGFATLGYSHPDADSFIIHVGQPNGNVLDIPLKKRSIWQ